jgi:hypothetical protein
MVLIAALTGPEIQQPIRNEGNIQSPKRKDTSHCMYYLQLPPIVHYGWGEQFDPALGFTCLRPVPGSEHDQQRYLPFYSPNGANLY